VAASICLATYAGLTVPLALLLQSRPDQVFVLRADLGFLVLGVVIAMIGLIALAIHSLRRRSPDRALLWLALFALPYGLGLTARTAIFRDAFAASSTFWSLGERFVDLLIVLPALLLFKEFYGRGWRSSVNGLIWSYVAFAAFLFTAILIHNRPDFIPAPGTGMVVLIPILLLLGKINGYSPRVLPNRPVLFFGLAIFFLAFSRDHLLNARDRMWRPGFEPVGFLVLVLCLGYIALRRQLAAEKQLAALVEEMRAATQIQNSILPASIPKGDSFQLAVRYAPMTAVAGDFYDFLCMGPGCLGVLVAEVAGHGVPAALVASMVKVAVASQGDSAADPGKVITGLNSTLCGQARGQYVTAVYLFLDGAKRLGRYCAAGHPASFLWRGTTQSLLKLSESGLLLGVRSTQAYTSNDFQLERRDRLLICTDGLLEAENPTGESFADVMLASFIKQHQHLGTDQFADGLLAEVLKWPQEGGRQTQADDITFVVLDVR